MLQKMLKYQAQIPLTLLKQISYSHTIHDSESGLFLRLKFEISRFHIFIFNSTRFVIVFVVALSVCLPLLLNAFARVHNF